MKIPNTITQKIINTLLIAFLIIIFVYSLTNVSGFYFINDNTSYKVLITITAGILLFFIIHILFNLIDRIKKKKIIRIIAFIFIITSQLLLIHYFDIQQTTDSFILEDQAYSIVNGSDNGIDYNFYDYFSKYKNNNFLLVLNIWLFKLFNIIKLDNITIGLEIFGMIMIDISLLLLYKLAKNLTNETTATKVLLLNIINPLNYFMIFWTYTCTYSLPFIIGVLLLTYKIKECTKSISRIIYSFLLSIVAVICFHLRPIIVIPIIAILICLILSNEKSKLKKYSLPLISILIGGILCNQVINYSVNKYTIEQNTYYPITHWIMMGYHNDGQVNDKDNDFTESFNTTNEKKEANIKEIKRTFNQYKISGTIKHEITKLPVTWSSGTSSYYGRLAQDRNSTNKLSKWIIGPKRDLLVIYCNSYRTILILFAIIGTYIISKKRKYTKLFVINLTIFGAMFFYLIWESKDIYSYPFISLLAFIACIGMEEKVNSNTKIDKEIFIAISLLICVVLLGLKYDLTIKESNDNNYRINVTNPSYNYQFEDIINKKMKITQQFETNGKFNTIAIKVEVLNKTNAKYKVILKNKSAIVEQFEVTYNDVSKDNYLNLTIPSNKGIPGKYEIEITSDENNKSTKKKAKIKNDSLAFYYLKTLELDNYKGDLKINDDYINGDLYIRIYDKQINRYMNEKTYYLLYIIVLILLLIEYNNIYGSVKTKRQKNYRYRFENK